MGSLAQAFIEMMKEGEQEMEALLDDNLVASPRKARAIRDMSRAFNSAIEAAERHGVQDPADEDETGEEVKADVSEE